MNVIRKTAVLCCVSVCCILPLAAEHRVALVIGNASYTDSPPANPVNDATNMAAKLRTAALQSVQYPSGAMELHHPAATTTSASVSPVPHSSPDRRGL